MEEGISEFTENEARFESAEERPTPWFMPDFARSPDVPRPLVLWRSLKKRYPDILKVVSEAAERYREQRSEKASVLFPLSEWMSITEKFFEKGLDIPVIFWEVERIASVCLWALGQGIYRFDRDLLNAVVKTEIPDNLPFDIFRTLPEYCVYTEVPRDLYEKKLHLKSIPRVHGFFAYLDDSREMRFPNLRIVLDTDRGIYAVPITLDPNLTLREAIELFKEDEEDKNAIGRTVNNAVSELIAPLLPLLLYICSEEPETDNLREPQSVPHKAELKKVRKGFRFFVPQEPRVWIVGEKIGEAIRKYASGGGLGKAKRPHLRRAHWHGYRYGKRGSQSLKVVWLPPIPVNADTDEKTEDSRLISEILSESGNTGGDPKPAGEKDFAGL
jgi:hypothetical protein